MLTDSAEAEAKAKAVATWRDEGVDELIVPLA